jgi:beta-galactosidase
MGGWEILGVAPRPGELRLWAYQSLAHGADGIVFFRWDTARYGAEQYWHGLLDHDRQPSRRYAEIKQMGAELARCGTQLKGAMVKAPAAMLLSYDSRFAFQIQANNPRFDYPRHLHQLYRVFHARQVPLDVVAPEDDLSAYRLVLASALHLVTEAVAANLTRYVLGGGTLVVTQRSGVKDESNAVVPCRLQGRLAGLCGVEVEEYDSLAEGMTNALDFELPELASVPSPEAGVLCDILKPTTARVVAHYQRDYYAGRPAITHNPFGKGQVVYVGAVGQESLYALLADWLMRLTGLTPLLKVPRGVEVTERWQRDRRLLVVLNHSAIGQPVPLDRPYQNLLDGQTLAGETVLAPQGVWVLVAG